jgi:hypothetical protein
MNPPTNPDEMVQRAVKALAAFGHLTADDARLLLGGWTHNDELTERQRAAVVDQVADVRRVDHAPGQGHGAPASPDRLPPAGLHGASPSHRRGAPAAGDQDDCAGCGQRIQYEARPNPQPGQPAGGWWHTGSPPPPTGLPEGWGRCDRCKVVRPGQHLAGGVCWWCQS